MCLKHFETTHGIVFIWKLPWISDGYINDFWNRIYLLTGTSKFPKGNHPKIGPQIRFGNHDVWYAKRWCVDEAHWKLGKYAVRRLVFSWQSWGILNHHLLVFLPVDPPFELGCNRKSLGCHWGVAGPSKEWKRMFTWRSDVLVRYTEQSTLKLHVIMNSTHHQLTDELGKGT